MGRRAVGEGRISGNRPAQLEVSVIELLLESRTEGTWTVLDVRGEVDLYTSPKLQERIARHVEQGDRRLLVNLEEVSFMDSSGLGVLVGGLKRLKEHEGDLALVCREGSIMKVLGITGLDKVFPIYQTVSEATSS